jgi:hypothetical protein
VPSEIMIARPVTATGPGAETQMARRGADQPRPMYGIFVAITVMNWTFASSGSVAM